MRHLLLSCVLGLALVSFGCGTNPGTADGGGDGAAAGSDFDGDGITDADERRMERIDSDGDGVEDYADRDSDDDGFTDAAEAGDDDASTPPADSDSDGVPDFQDTDSDNNGYPDAIEGDLDFDLDGTPNYRDIDDDGDFVRDRDELDGILDPPADSDGDGRPNFRDPDSDDDLILDGDEFGADTDRDGLLDYEDLDSDGDGLPDSVEAGDEDVFSPPVDSDDDTIADFRDPDSDNDGLADSQEIELGSDPTLPDTDGDGVTDLIELAAGTDPNDRTVSPRTRGDFVFVVDYMEDPTPTRDTLQFRTSIQFADIYFLFDASGSMYGTQNGLAMSVSAVMTDLTCVDSTIPCSRDMDCAGGNICSAFSGTCIEDPSMSSCILSAWTGAGQYGQSAGGGRIMINRVSLQPDPLVTRAGIDLIPEDGGTEPMFGAVWGAIAPMTLPTDMSTQGCLPMTAGRLGCAGFRNEAVKILVAFSDEDSDVIAGIDVTNTAATMVANEVTFIGVWSGGATSTYRNDMVALATMTNSVDRSGAPLVFDSSSSGSGIDAVVTSAINEIVEGVPLRVTIEATDEPGDAGDALQFIDYLQVNVSGGVCSAISPTEDTDGDTRADAFPSLLPGTPVCWDVFPARNDAVMPTLTPQVFRARLTVKGDGSPLDARIVYFLIPPTIELPGGPI
jgi:hypothetical protein